MQRDRCVGNVVPVSSKLRPKLQGKTVRAVLIVNPRNPDAGYFTLDELKPLVDWAVKKLDFCLFLGFQIFRILKI